MLRVFEAELTGDFADGQAGLDEELLRTLDDGILDVALGGSAALLADEVAKVVGREAGLVGKVCDGGQTVSFRVSALEILAKLLMEGGEDVAEAPPSLETCLQGAKLRRIFVTRATISKNGRIFRDSGSN